MDNAETSTQAGTPALLSLDRLRLRFRDPALESAFRADRFRHNAGNNRFAFLAGETAALEREITASLDRAAPTNLLAICGVGPLVAAKILGEVRDVRAARSARSPWAW